MISDFIKFLIGFGLFFFVIILILNPVDLYFPLFSEVLPIFKDKSIFEYMQENTSLVYFFVGGSLIFYITYLVVSNS